MLLDAVISKSFVLIKKILEYKIKDKISKYSLGQRITTEKKKKKVFNFFFKTKKKAPGIKSLIKISILDFSKNFDLKRSTFFLIETALFFTKSESKITLVITNVSRSSSRPLLYKVDGFPLLKEYSSKYLTLNL